METPIVKNSCEAAQPRRREPQKLVPVFRLFQPSDCEPAYFVTRTIALQMVRDGAAIPINRGKAVRLTFQNPQHLRDESCKIGPETMHAYAAGSERAIAAVDLGWGRAVTV